MEKKTRLETLISLHDEALEATISMEASILTLKSMDPGKVLEQKKRVTMRWDSQAMSPKEVEEVITTTVADRIKEMEASQEMNLAKLETLDRLIADLK